MLIKRTTRTVQKTARAEKCMARTGAGQAVCCVLCGVVGALQIRTNSRYSGCGNIGESSNKFLGRPFHPAGATVCL